MRAEKNRRLELLAAVLVLAASLAGCERTRISDINKHPDEYAGYYIAIAGKVTASGGDFKTGMFEVDDGTGRLWVVSDKLELPAEGSHIAVTGMVEPQTALGSNTLPTVLQEISRYEGG